MLSIKLSLCWWYVSSIVLFLCFSNPYFISFFHTGSSVLFIIWFWPTLDMKVLTGCPRNICSTWTVHSDKMSPIGEFVPLNWFFQKRSPQQKKMICLITFFRQCDTILGKLASLDYFSQTICLRFRWWKVFFNQLFPKIWSRPQKTGNDWQQFFKS